LSVAQRQEVMRVQGGVADGLFVQGALSPIVALIAFVGVHAEMLFQQGAQSYLRPAEDPRGPHGIEEIMDAEAEVAQEHGCIVIHGVKDFFHLRIGQQLAQRTQVGNKQRVNQAILVRGGKLNQAHLLAVGVQTVGLGIQGHALLALADANQRRQLFGVFQHARKGDRIGHSCC